MDPPCPAAVAESASRLRFRPIVVYGLLVKRRSILGALYVYYRNRMFHRIAEPTESGLDSKQPGHGVLLVECTCSKDDEVWNNTAAATDRLFDDLVAEGVVTRDEVVAIHHQRTEFGYPMFALGFEEHHDRVAEYVNSVSNLDSVGRQGAFCYPNMHETMRQGAEAAAKIIDAAS